MSPSSLEYDRLVQEAIRDAACAVARRNAQTMATRVSNRLVVTLGVISSAVAVYDLALLFMNVPSR